MSFSVPADLLFPMKQHLTELIEEALRRLTADLRIAIPAGVAIQIERSRSELYGEYAANIAMALAKPAGMKPRELAEAIRTRLPASANVAKVEIAGPGFLNFFLHHHAYLQSLADILDQGDAYGCQRAENRQKILIEFVSANPTGPLHIGHGRGAAHGDALANLLQAAGHDVVREYYVNDAGRQMDILAASVWLRYLQRCGHEYPYPENAYQGEYVREIAEQLFRDYGRAFDVRAKDELNEAGQEPDPEIRIDRLIDIVKIGLGRELYGALFNAGLTAILQDIRTDLKEFGVNYDNWFSEQSLIRDGSINTCLEQLARSGNLYEEAGATWFNSTQYGDEKDRVVARDNGQKTYFASDIAYHHDKFRRGFDKLINIWGADHHGYIQRVKGALTALGHDAEALEIHLVQFATIYRGGNKISMSTRSGQYVTLRELRQDVGNDAARYFYLTRKSEQHLDFDLDLAKSRTSDNPVFYIQYAHARICSVQQQMAERGYEYDKNRALKNLELLNEAHELALLKTLALYPEVVASAAERREPHQIGFYLYDLANAFHSYYNSHQFLVDDSALREARISLILATKQVIRNGLNILGVSAPERM
jgi:arginyl-tRNA synthetase